MSAFRFRLARLQRVRELREEAARAELMLAEQARREAEDRLAAARGDLAAAEAELARIQARGELPLAAIVAAQAALPAHARRIELRKRGLAERNAAADAARDAWHAARTDVRALGKLEERALGAHRDRERRREDRVLQEIVDRRVAVAGSAAQEDRDR
jgi:flagellar export protein FliJ